MTTYTCKACCAPANLVNGSVVRTCNCTAPIVASIQAVARGAGGVQ